MTPRLAGLLGLSAALWFGARSADTVVVTTPALTTTAPIEPAGTLPNRLLLRSGVFTLSAAYVPSLIVAIESERSADSHLYAPIVGPWFDLAARGRCEGSPAVAFSIVPANLGHGANGVMAVGKF